MKAYKIRTGEHYTWWLLAAGSYRADPSDALLSQRRCASWRWKLINVCVPLRACVCLDTPSGTGTAKVMLQFNSECEQKLRGEVNNLILL